jgi:hypothetical protein
MLKPELIAMKNFNISKIYVLLLCTIPIANTQAQSVTITPDKSEFIQKEIASTPLKFKTNTNQAAVFETTINQISRIDLMNASGSVGNINWGYNTLGLSGSKLELISSYGEIYINENGFIGVNKEIPTTAIDVNGEIKASSLQSTGLKPIFADQHGKLVKSPSSQFQSYGFGDFAQSSSSVDLRMISSDYAATVFGGYANKIILPIHLPDGSKFISCNIMAKDATSSSDLLFSFKVLDRTSHLLSNQINWTTDGSQPTYVDFGLLINEPVDNQHKTYFIEISAIEPNITPYSQGYWYANLMNIQQVFCEYAFE